MTEKPIPKLLIFLFFLIGFTIYLTGFGLVPGMANNIGPFEVLTGLIIVITILYFMQNGVVVRFHLLLAVLAALVLVASLGLFRMVERPVFGLIQWFLLIYAFTLLFIFFNLFSYFPDLMRYLFRFLSYGVATAVMWLMIESALSENSIPASGPFRNRVHIGIYMVSSFWFLLLYLSWPGVSRRDRFITSICILLALYGVAISGRRSVYLSLGAGLIILVGGLILFYRQDRSRIYLPVILIFGFIAFLYFSGGDLLPQLGFFQERAGLIDDRLRLATGTGEEAADDDNFILLQRQGMWAAVQDHPLLGIGWGGFFESKYSPTGHEMHSTPQKYLAELGIVGFTLYLFFSGYLIVGSARLFFQARESEYQLPTLIVAVAFLSLHISWIYNRSVTDRTYWLLIAVFMGLETLVYQRRLESTPGKGPSLAKQLPTSL